MIIIKYPEVTEAVMNGIKADMGDNEAPLLNAPGGSSWAHNAVIVMGNKPRGDATPTWYTPANPDYKTSAPWDAIAPWFVIFPGTSHAATNVRVKLSGIKVYALKVSDGKWVRVDSSDGLPVWAANWNFSLTGSGTLGTNTPRIESDGKAFKLRPEFYPIHGGTTVLSLTAAGIDPADVALIFVQIKSQLVLDDENGVDDRASAQLLVSIGADYYLETTTRVSDFSPPTDAPIKPSGGSRFGLVSSAQRHHYYSTINPPGADYPTISAYTTAGGVVALPVAEFEAKFSPLMLLNPLIPPISYIDFNFTRPAFRASDTNSATLIASPAGTGVGTLADPCSLSYLVGHLDAGEVGFLRGGNYTISSALSINNSGDYSGRIVLESYPGELAILDGSSVAKGAGTGQITVNGDFWNFRNIEVSGMPRNGLLVNGSHNLFEYVRSHGNGLNGIQVYSSDAYPYGNRGSWNIFIDCDSYLNSGVGVGGEHGDGENSDGFSISSGRGNKFIRPRAWGNSDDGFDAWGSLETRAEDLIIHDNGDAVGTGDGNGLKGGRSGYVGNFIAINALVYSNLGAAFTHNSGEGASIERITEWDNAVGFDLSALVTAERCVKSSATNFGTGSVVGTTNSWNEVGTPAFVSTDPNSSEFLKITTGTVFSDLGARRKLIEL